MTRLPTTVLPACLFLMLALGGCRSANTYQTPVDQAKVSEAHIERIITDTGVNKRAMVDSVYVSTRSGLTRVQVNIINRNAGLAGLRPDQHGFRYKFEWFAEDGMKVYDPSESWKRKTVEARELTAFTATAPSPEAVDWRLSLHRWKDH